MKKLLYLLSFVFLFNTLSAQIVINEIDPFTDEIELINVGTECETAAGLIFCTFPAYTTIGPGNVVSGDLDLAPGEIVVNGMSMSRRDSPYANSGTVVAVELEDLAPFQEHGVFAALEFQRSVEQALFAAGDGSQKAPALRLTDFVAGRLSPSLPGSSYIPGLYAAPLYELLPPAIYHRLREGVREFGRRISQ